MGSYYDERDSAQDRDGREEITQSKRFTQQQYSASGSENWDAELDRSGTGSIQVRQCAVPNHVTKTRRDRPRDYGVADSSEIDM